MNLDQRVRAIIGDLMVNNASLTAQLEQLSADMALKNQECEALKAALNERAAQDQAAQAKDTAAPSNEPAATSTEE